MSTMPRRTLGLGVLVALVVSAVAAAAPPIPPAEWLLDQVKILSAPETEGRSSGTAGAERAAHHIARVFTSAGLGAGGGAWNQL
jgi:hypothetical protein